MDLKIESLYTDTCEWDNLNIASGHKSTTDTYGHTYCGGEVADATPLNDLVLSGQRATIYFQ